MKKITIILISIFTLISCEEDNLETSGLRFKGTILGEAISLNENRFISTEILELGEPFNIRVFLSMFAKDKTAYQLTFTVPNDSGFNSFPVQQTGEYGFETMGGGNINYPFRFTVVEDPNQGMSFYTTYSKNGNNNVEITDIEYETDTTLLITGKFDCNLSFGTNSEIAGYAKDVEFKTRFLINKNLK